MLVIIFVGSGYIKAFKDTEVAVAKLGQERGSVVPRERSAIPSCFLIPTYGTHYYLLLTAYCVLCAVYCVL